jgi:hypothetical protein
MKVKIGNIIYDANEQPIMIILTDTDKALITNMHEDCTKYCAAPDSYTQEQLEEFMRTDKT